MVGWFWQSAFAVIGLPFFVGFPIKSYLGNTDRSRGFTLYTKALAIKRKACNQAR